MTTSATFSKVLLGTVRVGCRTADTETGEQRYYIAPSEDHNDYEIDYSSLRETWQPIETAPTYEHILLMFVNAIDTDMFDSIMLTLKPVAGIHTAIAPKHWQPLPQEWSSKS